MHYSGATNIQSSYMLIKKYFMFNIRLLYYGISVAKDEYVHWG